MIRTRSSGITARRSARLLELAPSLLDFAVAHSLAKTGSTSIEDRIRSVDDLPPNDRRRNHPRFQPENLRRNVELVQQLEAVAARRAATPAQAALAWLPAKDGVIVIPKACRRDRLKENLGALERPLDAAQLAELDRLFPPPSGPQPLEML